MSEEVDGSWRDCAITGRKPSPGDVIYYRGERQGICTSRDGSLCWVLHDGAQKPQPFIWRFWDGLNNLHDWDGKGGPVAPYGAHAARQTSQDAPGDDISEQTAR